MKVVVENVGQRKLSWDMEVWGEPSVAAQQILEEVIKRRALMSSDIDVSWSEDGRRGYILVGGFREVGTWRTPEEAGVRRVVP